MFVAGFIGSPKMNVLKAHPAEGAGPGTLFFECVGHVTISNDASNAPITIGIRPEHLYLADRAQAKIVGVLEIMEQLGEYALAYVVLPGGGTVVAKIDSETLPRPGDCVGLNFDEAKAHLFGADYGRLASFLVL